MNEKKKKTNKKSGARKLLNTKAGTATSSPAIINVMLWMKKNAYADSTIKYTTKRLKHLQRNCTLANPELIKTFIANKQCTKNSQTFLTS